MFIYPYINEDCDNESKVSDATNRVPPLVAYMRITKRINPNLFSGNNKFESMYGIQDKDAPKIAKIAASKCRK